MSGLSRRDRTLAFLALVAVAVLVGVASRPGAGTGFAGVGAEPLAVASQTALWLIVAADIFVTVAIVYALWTEREFQRERLRKRPWTVTLASYIAIASPTLLAALLVLLVRRSNSPGLVALRGLLAAPSSRLPAASRVAASATSGQDTVIGILLAALIVVAFLAWLFWPAPRRAAPARSWVTPVDQAVSSAVEESLDALRSIADPRRAIIAAYSAMEVSMSRAGMSRRDSEAPAEFVTRMLNKVAGVSRDLERLTHLFELAKFSDHEVDEEMRSGAIAALSGIRDRLRSVSQPAS